MLRCRNVSLMNKLSELELKRLITLGLKTDRCLIRNREDKNITRPLYLDAAGSVVIQATIHDLVGDQDYVNVVSSDKVSIIRSYSGEDTTWIKKDKKAYQVRTYKSICLDAGVVGKDWMSDPYSKEFYLQESGDVVVTYSERSDIFDIIPASNIEYISYYHKGEFIRKRS